MIIVIIKRYQSQQKIEKVTDVYLCKSFCPHYETVFTGMLNDLHKPFDAHANSENEDLGL